MAIVPIAVLTFRFDPSSPLSGDFTVRWATLALVVVIVAALVVAGLSARQAGLRLDDVAFVAVGIVPGAVIGGRLGYALLHLAFFAEKPERLLDPSIGGLELGLAVVGGFLTGRYVANLLATPASRWLHLSAAPTLLALGAGKLTTVLSGSGQGQPSDADWATAYLGPGPWGSLAPDLPSVPSQALEGIATLTILAVLTVLLMIGAFRGRDGRLFFVAVGAWALARALVTTTWRDPGIVAGFGAGGLIAIGIALACELALLTMRLNGRRLDARAADPSRTDPWAEVH